MKVHIRTVIDMATGEVLEDEWYEYEGPVAMAGGGGKKTQVQRSEPWSAVQGRLIDVYNRGEELYSKPRRYYPGSTVTDFSHERLAGFDLATAGASRGSVFDQSQGAIEGIAAGRENPGTRALPEAIAPSATYYEGALAGDYLKNPHMDRAISAALDPVQDRINAQFTSAGRFGSGYNAKALARGLGDVSAGIRMADYGRERALQQQSAQALGALNLANASQLSQNYKDDTKAQLQALTTMPLYQQGADEALSRRIGLLNQVGLSKEEQAQKRIEDNINRFNFRQDDPYQRLREYNSLLQNGLGFGAQNTQSKLPGGSRVAGAAGGAISGGVAGSQVAPGWGTVIGALLGGAAGYYGSA